MRLLLRLAWRNIWRQSRRTTITIGAMALGVAFCMATIALGDGMFAQMFRTMVRQSLGHVQVHSPKFPKQRAVHETIRDAAALTKRLDGLAAAAGASGRVLGYALLAAGDKAAGAQLTGIEPARESRVTVTHERILAGGRHLGGQANKEIILGAGLAESLRAGVGDEVVAVTQAADGSLGNELYRVVGVFKTGSVMMDRAGAFMHLSDLQELLVLPDQVHEIALMARDPERVDALAAAVRDSSTERDLLVRSWAEVNPSMAQMLGMQDMMTWIILFMVFSVAALGVLNTMLMSVFERTKELGVLRALGLGPGRMVALVLLESLLLAGLAVLAGGIIGLGLDLYLVHAGLDLSAFIGDWSFGGLSFSPVMYGEVRPAGIIATLIGLVLITVIASLWPAVRAARLEPVQAMRQE